MPTTSPPPSQMTDCSSEADFLPGTKWRCSPLPMLASETSRTSRSQKGRMTFLTGPDSFDKNGMGVHLFGYSSTIIGGVCRSTLQAETYALSDGVEESMRLRAALADAHGVFLRTDGNTTLPVSCVMYG